ncbi:hypothetical protein HYV49_05725, partial [Candidatus Pacearchaeota archaeon]|nr:hypothetical protein [Candidatus Pacearchaeota archaeon]
IPLTDISNLHNNIRNFCNDIIQDDIPPYNSTFDCRDKYGGRFIDTAMKNLNFSGFFLSLGFIIAFFSLVIWYLGKQKIKNKDFNDELYGIILLILFSIILLYLYNKYS